MTTGYTHKQWRTEAEGLVDALATLLLPGLEHMHADLVHVGAGEDQRARSLSWIALVNDLVTQGCTVLDVHDPRLTRVGEAQAAAGGVRQVAEDKHYNQRR